MSKNKKASEPSISPAEIQRLARFYQTQAQASLIDTYRHFRFLKSFLKQEARYIHLN